MTTMHEQAESILEDYLGKLAALGSADAIALHLHGKAVRAYCGNSNRCALAQDLQDTLHEHGLVTAAVEVAGSIYIDFPGRRGDVWMETPKIAMQFIEAFDHGQYPELIHPKDSRGHEIAAVCKR